MMTATKEVLCPYCETPRSYWYRKYGRLPNVGEGEPYPDISACPHLIADPLNNPEWEEDLLAAFLTHIEYRLQDLGVNVEAIREDELEKVRLKCEEIIRKHVKQEDGFFFRDNIADVEKAADELRPILIGLQKEGS